MGVFTSVFVPKGTKIWEFNESVDQTFDTNELNSMLRYLSKENLDKLNSWIYCENGKWILCGDNAKFFNHDECNPSTFEKCGVMFTLANRDLNPGDELTCNYKDFDDNDKLVSGELYPSEEESEDDEYLDRCEECNEYAWDGGICHACGMKEI